MADESVRVLREDIIADNYFPLKKVEYEQRCRDGSTQTLTREVYDCASGAAVLLYNRERRSVLLTRQFRIGAKLSGRKSGQEDGHDGYLLEAAAGMLDDAEPGKRARCESLEETGYVPMNMQPALQLFVSPASTTERIHLFVAEYDGAARRGEGGGLAEEGEDIEIVEMDFDDALARVDTGEIMDAKTVLLLLHLERKVLGRHGEAS